VAGNLEIGGEISVTEGETASILITRNLGFDGELEATLTIENGSAGDEDYSVATQDIRFADGQESMVVEITAIDDATHEDLEQLTITLTSNQFNVQASGSVQVTIVDNDPAPVAVNPAPAVEAPEVSASGGSVPFVALPLLFLAAMRRKFNKA